MVSILNKGTDDELYGFKKITKKALKELCKKNSLYQTPELNDVLYLHFQGYQDIECLEEYTGLKCLWLESNAISKIAGLENQKILKCLFLHHNVIKDIDNLQYCRELDTLNLSHNLIKTIQNCGVDILPVLTTLNLANNYIKTFEDLKNLTNCKMVSVLDLANNRIEDILCVKIFAQMPELRVLVLQGNPVVNLIPQYRKTLILDCQNLTYLDSRPVFPRDRACAEAWKKSGYEGERQEHERWNRKERKKLLASVNYTLRKCGKEIIVSSDEDDIEYDKRSLQDDDKDQSDLREFNEKRCLICNLLNCTQEHVKRKPHRHKNVEDPEIIFNDSFMRRLESEENSENEESIREEKEKINESVYEKAYEKFVEYTNNLMSFENAQENTGNHQDTNENYEMSNNFENPISVNISDDDELFESIEKFYDCETKFEIIHENTEPISHHENFDHLKRDNNNEGLSIPFEDAESDSEKFEDIPDDIEKSEDDTKVDTENIKEEEESKLELVECETKNSQKSKNLDIIPKECLVLSPEMVKQLEEEWEQKNASSEIVSIDVDDDKIEIKYKTENPYVISRENTFINDSNENCESASSCDSKNDEEQELTSTNVSRKQSQSEIIARLLNDPMTKSMKEDNDATNREFELFQLEIQSNSLQI